MLAIGCGKKVGVKDIDNEMMKQAMQWDADIKVLKLEVEHLKADVKRLQEDNNASSASSISIHKAAEKGDLEAIKKHIAAGTNINTKDGAAGETPLHRAITRGQTEAAKLLIEKGCDINIGRTRDGDTPLDMAEGRGRTEIAKLLREKGAKKSSN